MSPDLPPVVAKHVRITNLVAVVGAAMIGAWIPVAMSSGQLGVGLQNAACAVGFLSAHAANRSGRRMLAAALVLVVGHAQLAFALFAFGVPSGAHQMYAPMVVAPYLVLPREHRRVADAFAVTSAALWVGATFVGAEGLPMRIGMMDPGSYRVVNATLTSLGMLASVAGFVWLVDRTESDLVIALERGDRLLLNVLPPSIVARLKISPDAAVADRHDEVTVLFADLVGFTRFASGESAAQTVRVLNALFTVFDRICQEEGVERIKTLGDGYMAMGGAPEPDPHHAVTMVRVARRIRDHMATDPLGSRFQVRLGLHTGPVVGGIVGTARFHYDVWGDTVNVASRMESQGEPGRIQISETLWERVRDLVPCTGRGTVDIKGKGPMRCWFVD